MNANIIFNQGYYFLFLCYLRLLCANLLPMK